MIVDTTARKTKRLETSQLSACPESFTYRVVTFIVNVKLMEKVVKSHVGSVKVVKVASQYRKPGIMRRVRDNS